MINELIQPAGIPPLLLPLHALGRGDLAVAGGKGANLGELVRAGFPVPAGFVVTTTAYDRFVKHNHLGQTIARALGEQPDSGASIRDAFAEAPIPPEVERSILAAYRQLDQGAVAVRSSATAEDLPQAAFAGQQDSFLNVVGAAALLNAVRCCWSSLWSDRAITYRACQRLDQQTVKLAIVVQRMVAAEAAGVMFTANPVTGARRDHRRCQPRSRRGGRRRPGHARPVRAAAALVGMEHRRTAPGAARSDRPGPLGRRHRARRRAGRCG